MAEKLKFRPFYERLSEVDETGNIQEIDRWSAAFDRALADWYATHPDAPNFNSGQEPYWDNFEIEI